MWPLNKGTEKYTHQHIPKNILKKWMSKCPQSCTGCDKLVSLVDGACRPQIKGYLWGLEILGGEHKG